MSYKSDSRKARVNRLARQPQRSIIEVSVKQPKESPLRNWLLVFISALPGIVAVIALIFTNASLRATDNELQIEQKGQIIDRYNSAIANLGSTNLDLRLGGIYALQSLMQDSPTDQPSIIDVLSAYIRSHVPVFPSSLNKQPKSNTFVVPIDVQAVLNVLGARNFHNDGDGVIDLQGAELSGAQFSGRSITPKGGSVFPGADFENADLSDANFSQADLTGTSFADADLEGVVFVQAKLSNASFDDAYATYAFFPLAKLSHVNFSNADLSYAIFASANLGTSYFCGANLSHADLSGAMLAGVDLFGADLQGANLSHADLKGADLADAELSKADLNGADLTDATLPSRGEIYRRPAGLIC